MNDRASGLSDAAVTRLKRLGSWPELDSPRYAIVEEIGRGGMGTVYLATDTELGREVAIKVPHTPVNPASSSERRLQTEARALARLEHPGIVPIHDAGRLIDGRLFYVMKRVKGSTLRSYLSTLTDLTERLRVFERICEPVAFAHAHGFIHRDLKPDNIMVGAFGEVTVMDWGVVKVDGRQSSVGSHSRESESSVGSLDPGTVAGAVQTDDGTVVGTLGFMAPEQARGGGEDVDHRADVYSLGAILYLLLTSGTSAPEAEPVVTLRRQGVPRPLAAICGRALAADVRQRYQTVTALASDVARYRAGRAVDAYRETALERLVRFGRTYRTAILLVLAYIVMRTLVAFLAGR